MAQKFRIGLNYFFDNYTNSGIVNYIYNIVSALNTLDEDEKPKVVIFHSVNAPILYLRNINYPYIDFILFNPHPSYFFTKKLNSAIRRVFNIDIYKRVKFFSKIDCLYPYFDEQEFVEMKNKVYWIVDFNNLAFSNHYADKGEEVTAFQRRITSNPSAKVVLSSQALQEELKLYFPYYKCSVRILKFASCIPRLHLDAYHILTKYKITEKYFMCPNQFWEHKNHIIVLDAIKLIKEQNLDTRFKILFTGSLKVNRGKGLYIELLKEKIKSNQLEEYLLFLGVIEREEQLILMKNSIALVQPSLYEGWSTLVEEAKALNQFIILSDLPVHREQISQNVSFFDPRNANDLASIMLDCFKNPPDIKPNDYSSNVHTYGNQILNVLKN